MSSIAENSVPLQAASPSGEAAGEVYVQRLLENIYVMLTYANENGMPLPIDLRQKIDALFDHPDFGRHSTSTSFSKGIGRLWHRS